MLSLPEDTIPKQEFEALIKKKKMKLDKDLLAELENRFSIKKTKFDCVELRKAYMELYPDTVLPPPKPKKKKEKKAKTKTKKKEVDAEQEIAVIDFEHSQVLVADSKEIAKYPSVAK